MRKRQPTRSRRAKRRTGSPTNIKKAEYLNAKAGLQEWKDYSTIPNLSFHVLIQDPVRAFADSENGGMYNRNFVTTEEFEKILNQIYNNGYVLVDFNSFVSSNVDLILANANVTEVQADSSSDSTEDSSAN